VTVAEGQRHVLQEVVVTGAQAFSAERLRVHVAAAVGRPFTPRLAWELRARLSEFLARRGHPEGSVEFVQQAGTEPGAVVLEFAVQEGPRVVVGPIRVEGNTRTRAGFIRSRMDLEEGDLYDSEDLRKSFSNLYRTGLFERVQIELQGEPGDEPRALLVRVDEAPTLELFVEPGYGSYEGPRIALGGSERNFLGSGRTLQFESTLSEKAQKGLLSFVDPWFLRNEIVATGSLYAGRREQPSFTNTEYGVALSLARRLTTHLRASLTYRFRLTRLDDVDVVDPDAQEAAEDVDIASLALGASHDTRSDVFVPDDGTLLQTGVEWASTALGSEVDFFKMTYAAATFLDVWRGAVLAGSVESGWIAPLGATVEIPIQERFFSGGDDSVRSFAEDELGPRDVNGEPLGGEAATTVSVELRQEVVGNLGTALFWDLGNVEPRASDYLDFEGFRYALGSGLRYLLPIGPLRLDAAWNPTARGDEDDWVVHFSVGNAF
jgi:outer membrane protein assembly complex protein YaeT